MSEGPLSVSPATYRTSQIKLLHAASELVGGDEALAMRLEIRASLLAKFVTGQYQLPTPLLLKTVDLILDERESRLPEERTEQRPGRSSNG